MVYGTTIARFPAEALTGLQFPAPAKNDAALGMAADLLRHAWATERESDALAALRHALLPSLMSGDLRVRGAEAAVETT